MDNLRQLLAVIAGLTLLLSAVSGTNPNYFAGYVAFADDEDDVDDNSGSSHDDDNGEEEEHEENDEENDQKTVATFGTNSKVELEVEDHVEDDKSVKADLEVETEDGDLDDAEYAVMFNCTTPDVEKLFDGKLVVENGDGDFEGELLLVNGTTYEGCEVGIGDDVTVPLPTFMVNVGTDDEAKDEDDDEEKEKDRENGRGDDDEEKDHEDEDDDGDRRHHEYDRVGLELEDDGVEIKVKVRSLNMSDGTYDAVLTCDDPKTEMTIPGAFEVEDGEGELEAEIELANGTYNGCELAVGDDVLASFKSFTISEENDDKDVSDKRKEKRKDIISRLDGNEIHKRRMNANPASPGDYDPGWNYTLMANGTAEHSAIVDDDSTANVTIDMAVWKSNSALVLFSVLNGTVAVGAEEYEVELGYALYSVNHNVMRLFAFVSDDSGGIYKLKLRGHAAEDSEFPDSAGESIEMIFGGDSGPGRNSLNHEWELMLEGTVEAK